jgi:hypothetical protein
MIFFKKKIDNTFAMFYDEKVPYHEILDFDIRDHLMFTIDTQSLFCKETDVSMSPITFSSPQSNFCNFEENIEDSKIQYEIKRILEKWKIQSEEKEEEITPKKIRSKKKKKKITPKKIVSKKKKKKKKKIKRITMKRNVPQVYCCISACNNTVFNRRFDCLKTGTFEKKKYTSNERYDKICNTHYFKDLYISKKKK